MQKGHRDRNQDKLKHSLIPVSRYWITTYKCFRLGMSRAY